MRAVYLYPALGLFEGTAINVGRGTDFPLKYSGIPGLPTLFLAICQVVRGRGLPTLRIATKSVMEWICEIFPKIP